MWQEFRSWLVKSNVLALALAVVVGTALAAVVGSLVKDVLMPPIGLAIGRVDIANLFVDLSGKGYPTLKAAQEAGAPTINYGVFVNTVITFVIVAFVVFLIARSFVKEPAPAPTKTCPFCQEPVALAATRCSHCTSDLPGIAMGRVPTEEAAARA
jgi:large conductance mechanosensitive channel